MSTNAKPVSKIRVFLMWAILVGNILFWSAFWIWYNSGRAQPSADAIPAFAHAILMIFLGGFFLVAGVMSYLIVLFTHCLTFNFSRPVWSALKARLFIANIFVPLLAALGVGFLASAVLSPILLQLGLSESTARMAPVLGAVVILQLLQVWILVWSPLETRVIQRRLQALGITPEQLKSGFYLGLSNPARGTFQRFGTIEEDMGMLWFTPAQMVYWGDGEQWAIGRDQLVEVERRADRGSTTMLSGTAHVILHLQLPDGTQRQIRLHTEGVATMGGKRKAMDKLSEQIEAWRSWSGAAATEPGTA
ncbi:MAG: hypothetical protein JWR19_349 [Pedosphaera sp.]|nr:hypothetical protein [Pedosphaera sp.]